MQTHSKFSRKIDKATGFTTREVLCVVLHQADEVWNARVTNAAAQVGHLALAAPSLPHAGARCGPADE